MKHKALKCVCVLLVVLVVFRIAYFFYDFFLPKEIKNILLISLDTCRADYLSCYGCPKKTTPNIDAIAGKGILFENAFSPVPSTLPAHCSMLAGTNPPYHGVHDNINYVLTESNTTLAELLTVNGFTTGAIIGAFPLDSMFGLSQGFAVYNDQFDKAFKSAAFVERRGSEVTRYANEWLQEHRKERFFLFLHYFDPHSDYDPPEPFKSDYTDNPYAGEIAYVDHCIGKVIKKLKQLGLYNSTMIIITADHGEGLGEHNEISHSYFIYQSTIKVPLIFKLPGRSKSARITDNVGLIDIVPTVCSLLGLAAPPQVQGSDLSKYFLNGNYADPTRNYYCESFVPTKYDCCSLLGLVNGDFKYIQTTRPELYNLRKDPKELNDLINAQPHRARIMQDQLKRILERQVHTDNRSNIYLNPETRARLQSLGYVGLKAVTESFEFEHGKPDPKDNIEFDTLLTEAFFCVSRGEYATAEILCQKLLELKPEYTEHARLYYHLGNAALRNKKYAKAVDYLSKCAESFPQAPFLYSNLGFALDLLGRTDEAIESFYKALEIDPNSMEAYFNLGVKLAEKGRFTKAIYYLQKAQQLAPDDEDIKSQLKQVLAQKRTIEESVTNLKPNPDSDEHMEHIEQEHIGDGHLFLDRSR